MTLRQLLLATAIGLAAAPASLAAQSDSLAYFTRSHDAALPQLLSSEDRFFYSSLFEAIEAQNWDRVEVMLTQRTEGPLHGTALATYFLDPASPRIDLSRIEDWLRRYPDNPQVEAIVRLGQTRGLSWSPSLPRERALSRQPGITRRTLPSTVNDGTMPDSVRSAILERIRNDDPDGARLLLDGVDASLSAQARAEWRQRVAWSYYIENRDAEAYGMAQLVSQGSDAWVAEGDWVAGLAAWRLGDCTRAGQYFNAASAQAGNPELKAAAHYWAARSLVRCREPQLADAHLRSAARYDETLYGMLASEQLGKDLPGDHTAPDLTQEDWRHLSGEPAVREAIMLAEVGRRDVADEVLRWQVRYGDPQDFGALTRLARALGLAGAQTYMAYNSPRGTASPPNLRWPVAYHTPLGGWRIDPALAFAHALQESNFRERVVSPANAIGLMQIRPIAAREYASSINMSAGADLKDPKTNLAFGQRTLEALAQAGYTRGALPKVMAAYNAGPTPVARWNSEINDQGDPLLWMESIPYWETRAYVAIVMRNYWMYLRQADAAAPSRTELAENDWPQFPHTR
nr:lytic transglycosylase domain-containing protein [Erythrobacter sp. SD-21]